MHTYALVMEDKYGNVSSAHVRTRKDIKADNTKAMKKLLLALMEAVSDKELRITGDDTLPVPFNGTTWKVVKGATKNSILSGECTLLKEFSGKTAEGIKEWMSWVSQDGFYLRVVRA